jgi:hypothetical protein
MTFLTKIRMWRVTVQCHIFVNYFIIIIIIIIIWLYGENRALASPKNWGFVTITFLRGWSVSPAPNPQPGGPGLGIYDPRRQGGPAIPPGTGYPF